MTTPLRLLPLAAAALLFAGCGSASTPSSTSTPTRAPEPAVSQSSGAPVQPVDLMTLPPGPAPAVAYAVDPQPVFGDGDFHLVLDPHGATQPLRAGPVGAFTRFDNGRVVTSYGTEAGVVVEVLDADGKVVERTDGLPGYGLVTTPDQTIVGWLDGAGAPQVLEDGATRHLSLPAVRDGDHLGALLGSRTCQEQFPEGGGCTAFVDAPPDARQPRAWFTSSHGLVDTVPHLTDVRDTSLDGHLVGRLTGSGDGTGCFGELNPRGSVRWQTCDHQLTSMSPDGTHVIGMAGSTYGTGHSALTVYDDTGAVTAHWSLPENADDQVGDITWESDDSVLVVLGKGAWWSIVRLRLDGTAEAAVAPTSVGADVSPFRLPLS